MKPLLPALICLTLAPSLQGQTPWTLTTADFRSEPAALNSIDSAGVHVILGAGADEKVIPFDSFLSIDRPLIAPPPTGRFTLHLATGDRLGGEPAGVTGEQLLWKSPVLGDVLIPTRQLLAITPAGKSPPEDRRTDDVVTLSNADTVHGIVTDVNATSVVVQGDAGNNQVLLASVAQIAFASTPGGASSLPGYRVRLDDNSSIVGSALTLADGKVLLTLGKQPRPIDLAKVASIEQVNGPVSWLSSLPPVESVYTPYWGTDPQFPARMNRPVEGDEIRFGAQHFSHGIGVHARSVLSWKLDGTAAAFRTRYAIDGDREKADVTVRILLDGKTVYEQPHVRAGVLSPVILEDLAAAGRLTLEVDFGDAIGAQARLNWIEPALLKHKPVEPATATTQPN